MQEKGYIGNPKQTCLACGLEDHPIQITKGFFCCPSCHTVWASADVVSRENTDTRTLDVTQEQWELLIMALADSALRYEVEAEDYQSKSDAAMDTLRDIKVLKRKLEGV